MSSDNKTVNAFSQEEGTVNMGGIDALVRLTLDQSRADERRGLKTGMFISGYRGSPVGMLDAAFIKNQRRCWPETSTSSTASTKTWRRPRYGARRCCTPSASRNSTA